METTHKITRREKIELTMTILLVIAIATMIVAIIVLVKNVDAIKSNPIDYGIDNSEITMCTCFNQQGEYKDFHGVKEVSKGDGTRGRS